MALNRETLWEVIATHGTGETFAEDFFDPNVFILYYKLDDTRIINFAMFDNKVKWIHIGEL